MMPKKKKKKQTKRQMEISSSMLSYTNQSCIKICWHPTNTLNRSLQIMGQLKSLVFTFLKIFLLLTTERDSFFCLLHENINIGYPTILYGKDFQYGQDFIILILYELYGKDFQDGQITKLKHIRN